MRILAISGSLRKESSNKTLLRMLIQAAPALTNVSLFEGLAGIPPFNPDNENTVDSPDLAELRASLQAADVLVISTPEYAHGIPGVLKNALDWLVGSGDLSGKPVALLNASTRGVHAQASLREILQTMDAQLIEGLTVEMKQASEEEIQERLSQWLSALPASTAPAR